MNSIKEYYFPDYVFTIIKKFMLPSEYDRLERGGFDDLGRYRYYGNKMRHGKDGSMDRFFLTKMVKDTILI